MTISPHSPPQTAHYLMISKDFEKPISFSPTLARTFGMEEAIFLQWLHYFMTVKTLQERPQHDGRIWVYNSYEEWHGHLNFVTISGLTSAIRKLEDLGIILAAQLGANKFDRRKWYTIDYERLAELSGIPLAAIFMQPAPPALSTSSVIPPQTVQDAPKLVGAISTAINSPAPKIEPPAPSVGGESDSPAESLVVAQNSAPIETPASAKNQPIESPVLAENRTTAERRILVGRNRQFENIEEATSADFERLGIPDLRHIEPALRPPAYDLIVTGKMHVPSGFYDHLEKACLKLNVPFTPPDFDAAIFVETYTDSSITNSSVTDSSTNSSSDASASHFPTAPARVTLPVRPPRPSGEKVAKSSVSGLDKAVSQNAEKSVNHIENAENLGGLVTVICQICYPGMEVSKHLKNYRTKHELTRAAETILNQSPAARPQDFRLWPAFQHIMGWRFMTPNFVAQHWGQFQTYLENPSRFVTQLPTRLHKPDPFTHLRDEFVLDIPNDGDGA